jgi:Rnl2 family RNA ligase
MGRQLACDYTLFGELYGGNIQSEIKYSDNKDFVAFDLFVCGDINEYLTQAELEMHCIMYELPVLKTVATGTLTELLKLDANSNSPLAKENGFDSLIEGYVLKPITNEYLVIDDDGNKERVVIKYKGEQFVERKAKHETPTKKVLIDNNVILGDVYHQIDEFITNNRFDAVVSKIGDVTIKDLNKVLQLFATDVIDDMKKYLEISTDTVFVTELQKVTNKKSSQLVRGRLLKNS